jgi:tetratricopeptide (TPR) repeat protein
MTSRVQKRVTLLVAAFVLLVAGVAGAYAIKQAHTRSLMAVWLRDGMEAYKAGDYQKTMDLLGKYAGRDRTNEEVILALADSRRRTPMDDNKSHIVEAIRFARHASNLNPSDLAPREMLLDLYDELGRLSERKQTAESILAIAPTHHKAMDARVLCLARLGNTKDARNAAVALTAAYPDDVQAHRNAVELMSMLHEDPQTIREFADAAAAKNPDDQQFAVMRAQAHLRTGDAAGTIQLAKDAAAMPVKAADGFENLLQMLDLLGRVDSSLAALADQSLQHEMAGPMAHEVAGVAAERAWKNGHPGEARDYAAKAVDTGDLRKSELDALGWWTFLGVAGGKSLDDGEIRPALAELRARSGTKATFWVEMAQGAADLNSGRLREASLHLTTARAAEHKDDLADYLMGDVKQRLGEWRQAVTLWEKLASAQPSWRVIHVSLVSLLLQHGQAEPAVRHAEIALAFRPGLAEGVALTRALAMYLESGNAKPEQVQRAIAAAEGLETQAKDDAIAQSLAARIYLAGGKPEKGLAIVRKLIGVTPLPSSDVLATLAAAARPHDAPLADQVLALARAGAKNPDVDFQAAIRLADSGSPEDGRRILQQGIDANQGPDRLAYELRLAAFLDRTKDQAAAETFAKLAAANETNPQVQLALLDSDAAWKDEAIITAAIGRLRQAAGDNSVAWKINEARRLLVFTPSPSRAADAVNKLSDALNKDPGNIGALVLTAEAYVILGDRKKAVELLSRAVDADPDRPGLYPRLVELLQQTGAADEASRRLLAFCAIPNLEPPALRLRARLLATQGMWDQAAADFAALKPAGDPDDQFGLAVALSRKGQGVAAAQQLENLLKSPKITEPMVVAIADFFAGQGDVDRGRAVLEEHIPAGSQKRAAIIGAFCERFRRYAEAEQFLVEQAKDGNAESLAGLAKFYYKQNRLDEAKAIVQRGLAASPGNASLEQISGFIDLSKGGGNREALAKIAASLDTMDSSAPLKQLTTALQELEQNPGDAAGYVARLEAITKSNPNFFPAWRLLVEARYNRGEVKEAVDAARIAARSSPIDPRPARLATEIMSAAGLHDEAMVMAQQWRQRSVNDTFEPDVAIAGINRALKRYDDALRRLEPWKSRLIAEGDTAPERLQLYADLLVCVARTQEAQALVWPKAEKDPAWALRCLNIAADVTGPAQQQWVDKMEPLLEKSPAGSFAMGRALYEMALKTPTRERFQRAADVLKGAADDTAFRGQAALYSAACYQQLENNDQAARCYRIAIESNPNDAAALNNLAYILASDAATAPEAVTYAQRAVDAAEKQNGAVSVRKSFLDTLGVALLKCGRYRDAEDTFRKGLSLDPTSLDLGVGLAEAALAQGNPDQTRTFIRQWDQRSGSGGMSPDLTKRVDTMRAKLEAQK